MTAPFNPADITRLRELIAAATPGPWEEVCAANRKHVCILEVSGGTPPGGQYSPPRRWKIVGKTLPHAPTDQDANAAIIVAAVNALPALLDQLAAQAAEIERLRSIQQDIGGIGGCADGSGMRAVAAVADANKRADRAEARVEELEAQLRRIASTSPRAWHRPGCAEDETCVHCRALIDEARDALGWARWPAGTGSPA